MGWVDNALSALRTREMRLLLTSATLLFVELLLIRWIPANVIYVGFFNNFVLMASFLGIGCGILLGRGGARPRPAPFPFLLFLLMALVYSGQFNARLPTTNEVWLGTTSRDLVEVNVLVLAPVILLATAVMASLAMPLGPLLASMPPLRAYAIDIVGSLCGIAAFVALAALGTPPLAWFVVAATLAGLLALGMGIDRHSVAGAVAIGCVLLLGVVDYRTGDLWSPYYRVTLGESAGGPEQVSVNGVPFQTMWPVDFEQKEPTFDQLYKWLPGRHFGDVLIVGAGTGTDTAVALKNGAGHVDAVEIDPLMLELGEDRHPNRPYDDPRVTRFVNDARAFLRTTDRRYDLIVFAQTDSLTLVSATANLRLESFLFTQEAFETARDHLAPGGIFVMYNWYREAWLVARYGNMLDEAFGSPPIARVYPRYGVNMAVLADGPGIAALRGTPPGDQVDALDLAGAPSPTTDDRPFPYLRTAEIPERYLLALAIMLVFAVIAIGATVRSTGGTLRRFSPHFFILGTAFLLLETRSLVTFGLLFGTTWIVNALVFFAILVSVLAAIGLNARFRFRNPRPLYGALLLSLLVGYVLPPASLLFEPAWLRYVVAALLTFSPVFFANLVFTRSFADTRSADMAFASNLIGAMFGGIIEWSALAIGYQGLLPIVAACYVGAYLLASPLRLLADRQLELRTAS